MYTSALLIALKQYVIRSIQIENFVANSLDRQLVKDTSDFSESLTVSYVDPQCDLIVVRSFSVT